jgi:hypothetical protein
MVPTSPEGPAGAYGYWMQPAADGRTGLLFPGYWMTSYSVSLEKMLADRDSFKFHGRCRSLVIAYSC